MGIVIYLNGKKEETEKDMSISKLLEIKKIRPQVVTVELNDEIIQKDKYHETLLKPNDRLEFVYYMGGGGSTHFVPRLSLGMTLSESKGSFAHH